MAMSSGLSVARNGACAKRIHVLSVDVPFTKPPIFGCPRSENILFMSNWGNAVTRN